MLAFAHTLLGAAFALLAPGGCSLCGARLTQAQRFPVCEGCLQGLSPLDPHTCCVRCFEPLPLEALGALEDDEASTCVACQASPPRFVRATAYGLYESLREAIHLLKFDGVHALALPLGALLAQAILQHRTVDAEAMTVVPVPLFRGKRASNQSTLLATEALRSLRSIAPGWVLHLRPALLKRVRQTESQFLLSPAERRTNLRGAFAASSAVCGLNVLLIDDVYTTGTTARECTRALLAAGARSVRVATLARAGRDTAVRWRPGARAGRQPARDTALICNSAQTALHPNGRHVNGPPKEQPQ